MINEAELRDKLLNRTIHNVTLSHDPIVLVISFDDDTSVNLKFESHTGYGDNLEINFLAETDHE